MATENQPRTQPPAGSQPAPLNILLAYDGSKHAQAAVDMLASLPLGNSMVTCLAVMGTQQISGHEALLASLEDAGERLRSFGLQVQTHLQAGNPAVTINDWVQLHNTSLTVIGARGLRSTLGILLGGVAQQVVEYSTCPVLVVREPFTGIRRVLLVIDGSEFSRRALVCVAGAPELGHCRFPLPEGVDIRLMYVLPPSLPPELASRAWTVGPEVMYPVPARPVNWEKLEAEEEIQGKKLLADELDHLKAAGLKATSVLRRGDAATEIIDYLRNNEIDLVICGSRGLNPVSGWLLGSVSRKLVHYAGCSVLIVK